MAQEDYDSNAFAQFFFFVFFLSSSSVSRTMNLNLYYKIRHMCCEIYIENIRNVFQPRCFCVQSGAEI